MATKQDIKVGDCIALYNYDEGLRLAGVIEWNYDTIVLGIVEWSGRGYILMRGYLDLVPAASVFAVTDTDEKLGALVEAHKHGSP